MMVNVKLDKATPDFSRWTMMHELWKNGNILAAVITVDGAWIVTKLRKLAKLPKQLSTAFKAMPRTFKYMIIDKK